MANEIGRALREKRLARKFSLERVHHFTRIPVGALEALEAGNEKYFAAPVYMRGFLEEYCEFLELDFKSFEQPVPETQRQQPVREDRSPDEETERRLLAPRAAYVPKDSLQSNSVNGSYIRLALMAALALSFGTLWLWRNTGPSAFGAEEAKKNQFDAIYEATFISKLRTTFKTRGWARIQADGEVVFEGYAPAGMRGEWKASKNFTVQVENPDDVSLALDNKTIKSDILKSTGTMIPVTFSEYSF